MTARLRCALLGCIIGIGLGEAVAGRAPSVIESVLTFVAVFWVINLIMGDEWLS